MAPHMICMLPYLNSNARVRRLRISVPLVPCLLDDQKYFRPDDLPPPAGEELRPLLRPRLTLAAGQRTATPRWSRMAAICAAPQSSLR
jgi:hypothetical protein